jgi:nickel superoxide dismutase
MKTNALVVLTVAFLALPWAAWSHCQIPCGIYDDAARMDMLTEHITTIEKSMTEIAQLSSAGDKNYNQLVRWIMNKDDHAEQFQDIVSSYFLTQRIAPVDSAEAAAFADYQEKVTVLHQMLVYAMKCKQTIDKANTDKLRELLEKFRTLYFKEHGHEH